MTCLRMPPSMETSRRRFWVNEAGEAGSAPSRLEGTSDRRGRQGEPPVPYFHHRCGIGKARDLSLLIFCFFF